MDGRASGGEAHRDEEPGRAAPAMRKILFLAAYLLPGVFAVWSIVRLFRNRNTSFLYQWQRAFGWLALCSVPFPPLQALRGVLGMGRISFDALEALLVLPGSWYVLFGGKSVVYVFEENVKDWTGHRRDTMFDNAPVFFALVLAQVLVLSLLVGWRFHKGKSLRDPVVLGTGIFMAVNAALAMSWPWFGT